MAEVLRAWARLVDRHLFTIFILKIFLGSGVFIALLSILGDFGRDCRVLKEVEQWLEECSLRRLELEQHEMGRRESKNGSRLEEQLMLCERKVERQSKKLEDAEVELSIVFILIEPLPLLLPLLLHHLLLLLPGEGRGHQKGFWGKTCSAGCKRGSGGVFLHLQFMRCLHSISQ